MYRLLCRYDNIHTCAYAYIHTQERCTLEVLDLGKNFITAMGADALIQMLSKVVLCLCEYIFVCVLSLIHTYMHIYIYIIHIL